MTEVAQAPPAQDPRLSLGFLVGIVVVAAGAFTALDSLRDNSFLTHLATGRLILSDGSVPTADPYTFTATGEPWVVQSWLASVLYASAERLGGLDGVRVLSGVLAGVVSALGWRLLRPAEGLVTRMALAALFLVVGAGLWAERPFMIGLIALGLTIVAAEGGLDPRWLVPVGWVWVNSHGSFPLGLVYLAVAALGARLDRAEASRELRCLKWGAAGVVLGVVGPLGPRLLLFPLELLQRQELLRNVVEWQAPTFESASERAFLLQVMLAIVLLARRPSYRSALLAAVFVAAALLGSRNVVVASLVLLPILASTVGDVGGIRCSDRPKRGVLLAGGAVALAALLVVARLQSAPIELRPYPVGPLAYLEGAGIDTREHRLAAPEFVGNLLTFVYGAEERVFYDDRFDMFPEEISKAQLAVTNAELGVFDELEALDVELVTVRRSSPMARALTSDPGWRIVYTDERWLLACDRTPPSGAASAC